MKTWDDYKDYIKEIDDNGAKEIAEIENLSSVISSIIAQRNNMGLSQRELAELCNMPQSSIARIESHTTVPKLDTLIRMLQPLGLRLNVSAI